MYRNCSELQLKTGLRANGEFKLHLNFPHCKKPINVYCDGMDTGNPREYITLKNGEDNNFSIKNYVGSPDENTYPSSKTTFSKVDG